MKPWRYFSTWRQDKRLTRAAMKQNALRDQEPWLPDCQMACDADCEMGKVHCWNWHRGRSQHDWHDPEGCDSRIRPLEILLGPKRRRHR